MDDMDYSSAKYPTFPRKFDRNAHLGEEEGPFDEDELARRYRDFSGRISIAEDWFDRLITNPITKKHIKNS